MRGASFYDKLYLLQDEVLRKLNGISSFYLTGETAISRFNYGHRYSEDLGFFLNYSDIFRAEAKKAISVLEVGFSKVSVTMDMESINLMRINWNVLLTKYVPILRRCAKTAFVTSHRTLNDKL